MFIRLDFVMGLALIILIINLAKADSNDDLLNVKSMSSAEVMKIGTESVDYNPDHKFVSTNGSKKKSTKTEKKKRKPHRKQSKNETEQKSVTTTTTQATTTTTEKDAQPTFAPPNPLNPAEFDVEELLNVREIKFETNPPRKTRSADGQKALTTNVDEEQMDETAPPELKFQDDDELMQQLRNSKIVFDRSSSYQGGNVKFVDFDETLKATVPYEKPN